MVDFVGHFGGKDGQRHAMYKIQSLTELNSIVISSPNKFNPEGKIGETNRLWAIGEPIVELPLTR